MDPLNPLEIIMTYPQFGTVIHATLRNEDLLAAFADELERLGKSSNLPYHPAAKNAVEDARAVTDFNSEDAGGDASAPT